MDISNQQNENTAVPKPAPRGLHGATSGETSIITDDSGTDVERYPTVVRVSVMVAGGALCWAGLLQGVFRLIAMFGR